MSVHVLADVHPVADVHPGDVMCVAMETFLSQTDIPKIPLASSSLMELMNKSIKRVVRRKHRVNIFF